MSNASYMMPEAAMAIANEGDVKLRYYIPFYVPDRQYSDTVKSFVDYRYEKKFNGSTFPTQAWTREPFPYSDNPQLYDHILNLMNVRDCKYAICSSWKYELPLWNGGRTDDEAKPPLGFLFEKDDLRIEFRITDVYAHLFNTGVGILSYDLTVDRETLGDGVRNLVVFQNLVKKISYDNDNPVYLLAEDKDAKKSAVSPGQASSEASKEDGTHYLKKGKNGKHARCVKERCRLSVLFGGILKNTDEHIRFFEASKDNTRPDLALLCSYMVYDHADRRALKEAAYRLARGYDEKYLISDGMLEDCPELFDNIYYCSTLEGSAVAVGHNPVNEGFFVKNMEAPRRTYAFLYLYALYQHYSLIAFTTKISKELPSDTDDYLGGSGYAGKMERLIVDINTFLMKSDLATVSNIQHHNQFYANCRRALSIEEDKQSLQSGFENLEKMQAGLRRGEQEEARRQEKEAAEKHYREEERHRQEEKDEAEERYRKEEEHRRQEEELQEKQNNRLNVTLFLIAAITVIGDGYASVERLAEMYHRWRANAMLTRDWVFIAMCVLIVLVYLFWRPIKEKIKKAIKWFFVKI